MESENNVHEDNDANVIVVSLSEFRWKAIKLEAESIKCRSAGRCNAVTACSSLNYDRSITSSRSLRARNLPPVSCSFAAIFSATGF